MLQLTELHGKDAIPQFHSALLSGPPGPLAIPLLYTGPAAFSTVKGAAVS